MGKRNPNEAVLTAESTKSKNRIVLISPCRDEEETLERTLACVMRQTLVPAQWIIVDDGSTDRTPEILEKAAKEASWITVISRNDRGFRKVGGGVIDAFYAGHEAIDVDYDFVAKMDVDLEFSPRYLERAMQIFAQRPKLACLSGKVFRPEGTGRVEEFMIDDMVAGQFKLYRREAFDKIGGFVREVMWDGIDFHRCRLEGFETASIADPLLDITHLRLMGSSDKSVYRGRMRWGAGQWFMGSSLSYVIASGVFRFREAPIVAGGLLIIWGYIRAGLGGNPRYEDARFRKSLRSWQSDRLVGVLKGRGAR
jgi:biofilm PGA synthesis N-glycosyltransferase PgaC